jgi:ATP-dependent Lhr-like helicase
MNRFAQAEQWFVSRGWQSFAFQREVWAAYLDGESGLIHAATGTGKTLAAWWGPLLEYIEAPSDRSTQLRVLWITPLRALASDTANSLSQPIIDLQ